MMASIDAIPAAGGDSCTGCNTSPEGNVIDMQQFPNRNVFPRYSPALGGKGNSNLDDSLVIGLFQGGCIVSA
jgi:hypothetical protein